jgi:transposase-like protein
MQILHPFPGSIQRYAEEISDSDRYRPDHCPQCEAKQPLTGHGFYRRTLVDAAFDGVIRVRRYLCRNCKRTVSLLPEFALNGDLAIQSVMARILECAGRVARSLFCWYPAVLPLDNLDGSL